MLKKGLLVSHQDLRKPTFTEINPNIIKMDKKKPDPKENVKPKLINQMRPLEVDKLAGEKLEESQAKLLPGQL